MISLIPEKITYIRNRLTRIQSSIKRKEIEYAKYIENYEYNPQYRYINFEYESEIKDLYEQYNRYHRKLERCNIRLERLK
jgi:hypothetical protein